MNSSNENNEMRDADDRQPDDTRKKNSPAPLSNNGNAPDHERDRNTRPVGIDREKAEENIPSAPDPDDPVSP